MAGHSKIEWTDAKWAIATLQAALIAHPRAVPTLIQEAIDRLSAASAFTDDEIRAEWRAAGGSTHGPNVESVTMSEAQYLQFRRSLTLQAEGEPFQEKVGKWMDQCFLPSLYGNMVERGDRLLEEVLELLQAHGYDRSRIGTLADYVYGRPIGEPGQEVGGVMITLAGFCYIAGLDMHTEGLRELERISRPEVMAKIRAKQKAKNALHFDTPLPGNAPDAPAYNGKKEG